MSAALPIPSVSPIVSGIQMFAAPVDRGGAGPKTFDPSRQGRFALNAPPAGWLTVGTVTAMERGDTSQFAEIWSGTPATVGTRARGSSGATLRCSFSAWSKLAMALSSGSQQMNLLRTAAAFTPAYSGGTPESAAVLGGSDAAMLRVPLSFAVSVGDVLAVDEDYAGQTGYMGSPIAGAYVSSAARVNNDANYLRRITYNLAQVLGVVADTNGQTVTLASALPAGVPTGTMRVSSVTGFVDRVGGTYLAEWSVLLVADGIAGDRVLLHYPRLQVAPGQTETRTTVAAGLERWRLQAEFLALPVTDSNDGDAVLCYRSYLPAPMRTL